MKAGCEIDIEESEDYPRKAFLKEKRGPGKERIHMLYLLKKGVCRNIKELTRNIPRDRGAVRGRIKKYKTGGTELLRKINSPPGRKPLLTDDILNRLKKRPEDTEGFGSYNEIHRRPEDETGININKKTLYHICHYKLKSVSRVPRPCNPEQNPGEVLNFRENFSDDIKKRKRKRRNTGK